MMFRVVAVACLVIAGCRCDSKQKPQPKPYDGGAFASIDATVVTSTAETEKLFLGVPTAAAAQQVLDKLATQPPDRTPGEHVGREIAATLGRLGWKIGLADHPTDKRTLRNILGFLPGASDEAIVIGSDFNAFDQLAGTAAVIEIARGLTAITRAGWKPKRTIVIAFWDSEDVAGAELWAEQQRAMLTQKGIAYFGVGVLGDPAIAIETSPALREHLRACSADAGTSSIEVGDVRLGGGTFLHRLGLPSVRWRSRGRPGSHDRAATAERFAKVIGLCAIRLASAEYLPLRFSDTAAWLTAALDNVGAPPTLDRARIDKAIASLATAAMHAESLPTRGGGDPAKCNRALATAERGFLVEPALAGHPTYRHVASGPGPQATDDAAALPELAAAIHAKDDKAIARAVDRLVTAIDKVTATLGACP